MGYIPGRSGLEEMEFPGTFCIEERDMENIVHTYCRDQIRKKKVELATPQHR